MSPVTPTLGTHMRQRRIPLELTQTAAAKQADVQRSTWSNWERDINIPEGHNHARIERVLRWRPGSVADFLDRLIEPVPLPAAEPAEPSRLAEEDVLRHEIRAERAKAAAALARADALEARLKREAVRDDPHRPETTESS